jgi:hypothetical protein
MMTIRASLSYGARRSYFALNSGSSRDSFGVVGEGLTDRTVLRDDRGHASVDAMRGERMGAPRTRQLRKAVCEVAEGSSAQNCNKHKGCHGDARACIEAVQQKHKTGDCRRRDTD